MGNLELPGAATGSKQMLKVPVGTYEFGANLISEKGVSRQTSSGRRLHNVHVHYTVPHICEHMHCH